MGQPITVTSRPGVRPEVFLFDLNRSITGMGVERYPSVETAVGNRPADVLARRLFALGATQVTVYSNVVTVEAPGDCWPALESQARDAIGRLFVYYGDDTGGSPEAHGDVAVGAAEPQTAAAEG